MRRVIGVVSALAIVAAIGMSVSAKGETVRIIVAGGDLSTPIAITDENILRHFNVWSGPGTGVGANGVRWTSMDGFIIDWRAGIVQDRPAHLPRYEVSFDTNRTNRFGGEHDYIVFYENDRATGNGYVYLPGRTDPQFDRNVWSIVRGVEGNWFRSSRTWQDAVSPLLARSSRDRRG